MGGAWVYYVIYIFAFFCVCCYGMWNYENEENTTTAAQGNTTTEVDTLAEEKEETKQNTTAQRKSTRCTHGLAILIAFLNTAFAASYILADNRLPLACSTMAETNLYPQSIIRLVLWGVTIILGVLVLICWITYAYFRRYVEL